MRNYVAIVVAVVLAIVAWIGLQAHVKTIEKQKPGGANTIQAVKAKRDIEKDEMLTADSIEPADITIETAKGMNIITWAERSDFMNNYRVQKKTRRDTLITKELLLRTATPSMATELSKGERAITIAVDQVSGVGGHIKPSDHVDIYASFTVPSAPGSGGSKADLKTYLLLSNVRVLRTGTETSRTKSKMLSSRSTGYASVTLRVKEGDAHILALSQAQGRLTLALRPPGDSTQPSRRELDMSDLVKILGKPVAAPQ